MKFKSFFLSLLSGVLPLAMQAQQVTISPVPQEVTWGDPAFRHGEEGNRTVVGEDDADTEAMQALTGLLEVTAFATDAEFIIGERGDAAVAAYESEIPNHAEGYYLSVQPGKIVIAGHDGVGTFYAVQTLKQIVKQPVVHSVTVKDWPDVTERGVVEGFYGNNWSQTDRIRQFQFYGENKMNVYIYGPKDDPYHRGQWRVNYPADKAALMRELVEVAHANKVQFVWAIHPGVDIKWNKTDSLNVVKKLEAMYELGVRSFAVFFDDISGEGTSGIKQAQLLNYVTDEFVRKHDDVNPLIMCPTEYNRGWSSDNSTYLSALKNNLYPEVRVMWTGNSVVDFINKGDHNWINPRIGRKAYIWLNYPVTDYCARHLLMGPTYGNDLDIADMLSGYTSNPMEYAEASMLSLYSIADYTWHMATYDSNASWERAIRYLMPTQHEAFHVFCEHNVDLGSNTHGLRRTNESVAFKAVADDFKAKMAKGYDAEALAALKAQFDLMVDAADTLLTTDENGPLMNEIKPWVQVMKLIGQRGQLLTKLYQNLNEKQPEAFVENYLRFVDLEEQQKTVMSRDFAGSIKPVNPIVADVVVGPFLKEKLSELINEYKHNFDYRLDVFPVQLIEDGDYYIKVNGKYLTNATSPNGYPTLKAEEDLVNPTRQYWTISLDLSTNRYKIVSAHDNRYLNEKGEFTVNNTTNPYESAWHSYNMTRLNGMYAIQNAGSAGSNFWSATAVRVQKGTASAYSTDNFLFEIIPVGGETTEHPTLEENKNYMIRNEKGLYLTNNNVGGSGGNPVFMALKSPLNTVQAWKFTVDSTTKRFKMVSARDNRYVNEKGNFGTNAYISSWNTYGITESGGLFSIQNAGDAGTDFWFVDGNRISYSSDISLSDSYVFTLIPFDEMTAIQNATADENGIRIVVDGKVLCIQSAVAVRQITLCTMDGKVVRSQTGSNRISLAGLDSAPYVVRVTTADGVHTEKVLVK